MSVSPNFKNLGLKPKQSPKELKEKMRKNYKDKIQNHRSLLMDKLRSAFVEKELNDTLTDIYKSMFDFSNEVFDEEEYKVMEEIKNDLIQEELEWLTKEYDKFQLDDVDWSSLEQDDNVICPVCQKTNLKLSNNTLNCTCCNIIIKTQRSLPEIKVAILTAVESHNSVCTSDIQFGIISENIYILCESCNDLKLVL